MANDENAVICGQHIQDFNQRLDYLISDFIVERVFSSLGDNATQNLLRDSVYVLNTYFHTHLYPNQVHDIAVHLFRNWHQIWAILDALPESLNGGNAGHIFDVAHDLFPPVFEAANRNVLSFASKFFHWCGRGRGCFPIYDSRVTGAIAEFADLNIHGCPMERYRQVVNFYSGEMGRLPPERAGEWSQIDAESQQNTCAPLSVNNTLLRILDKCFFMMGE